MKDRASADRDPNKSQRLEAIAEAFAVSDAVLRGERAVRELTKSQIARFWEQGFIVVEDVLDQAVLDQLNAQYDAWLEESRSHSENYGETIDGKKRFDLDPAHSAEAPRFRRIASPAEVSEIYYHAVVHSCIPDMVAQLIGPSIRLHHCKIVSKSSQSDFTVDWHQDGAFDPHTNTSMLAAGLLLTDVFDESSSGASQGPLRIVPGSHRSRFSLYRNDEYTGVIDPAFVPAFEARAVPVVGHAGAVSFHHCLAVHASPPNHSDLPRTTLYAEYMAADNFPLTEPATPSSMYRMVVRGEDTRFARLEETVIEIPGTYAEDSFFSLQENASRKAQSGAAS